MAISHKEAVEFVRDKLGVKDVLNHKLDLNLLNKVIRGLLSEVPFQNIFLYTTPPERRFPSVDDVIRFGLSLHGGVCIHNNWFAALLLKALGFDLFTIAGMYASVLNSSDDHLMSVVRGLRDPEDPNCKETLFLVDVGNGFPTPGGVPLHRIPHQFPLTAGIEIRYEKIEGLYYRMHRRGDPVQDPNSVKLGDGWVGKFSFTLEPKEPTSVQGSLGNILRIDPPSNFMSFMRIFRWPKDQGGRAVAFRGKYLMFFGSEEDNRQESGTQKQAVLIEDDALEDTVLKYFPNVDQVELHEAMPTIIRNMNYEVEST